MSAAKEENYNSAIDLLRILSILSVILIHTTTKILEYTKYDLVNHSLTLSLNQFPRFAVPLFFLISAFVLELNYPQKFNYFSYLKKRFSRLFLPYLFWSVVYYFVIYPIQSKSFIANLFLGDASYQLYFIPALFIFYIIFPLFHNYLKFIINKFSLLILGLIQIILLSYDYYIHPLPFPHPVSVFLLNFNVFILGILASHYQKNILTFVQKYRWHFLFISILLSLFIFFEGKTFYLKTNNYLSFYSQWRPSIYIYTLLIGPLFYYIFSNIRLKINLIKKIASYSFLVYFIHVIFIELIWKILPKTVLINPLVPFVFVSILSYLTALIVSKIPYLSKITG